MKLHLLLTALLSVTLVSAQQRTKPPNYDPAKEIKIEGTVEKVLTPQHGGGTGVHLTVKTSEKTFDVHIGPAWFVAEKQFTFSTGDQVVITGATISTSNGEALIAREVRKGDAVLVLRDSDGFPMWSGARGRPKD